MTGVQTCALPISLVEAAAGAGADAVKLQYFEADALMSGGCPVAGYQRSRGERDARAMLGRLELSLEAVGRCAELAREHGMASVVTVFSAGHAAAVAGLGVDALKSASPDIVNRPLLLEMAGTGLPMIVSTGGSELFEVERAVGWLEAVRERVALMQCVSAYPVPVGEEALGGIGALRVATGLEVGYSDHTVAEDTGAMAASGHGAALLEKHLTHDRRAAGPDHGASLDPQGLARYVERVRAAGRGAYRSYGSKRLLACERDVRSASRQSVVAARDLAAGEVLGARDLVVKRPGDGIEPWCVDEIVGRAVFRDIAADTLLGWGDIVGLGASGDAMSGSRAMVDGEEGRDAA